MAEQYAGLSLGVDVSQVDRAVKSLREFAKANDGAADSTHEFLNQTEVAKQKAKDHARELSKQAKEYSNVVAAIDPTVKSMNRLRETAKQLDALWKKGVVPDDEFFRLGEVLESQEVALRKNQQALTAEGRAAAEASRQKEVATKAGQNFIKSLEQQALFAGKTAQEVLELKAAQLGVSEQAAPFIAQLNNQAKGLKLAGVSAGQYAQAMRMLPAQITDVVTSLASGMPVWLVAIQQGGQIKDSFGGLGNTFKVLLSFLNPLNVGLGVTVGALGALIYKVVSTRNEIKETQSAVNTQLGITGDYADRLSLNIMGIAKAADQSADEVIKAFISTKDGAEESLQKMLDVGISYDEARQRVEQYKKSGDFTALNVDIEQHRLKVLEIKDAWSDAAEEVKNYYTGANEGKQSVALGGAVDPIVKVLEQAKTLNQQVNTARIEGNKHVAKTVDLINKEYLAADRVAGAEKALADARKNANAIAASGNKEAIANAQKLIKIREDEVKQAKEAEKKKGTKGGKKGSGGITRAPTEQLDKELYVLQAQLVTLQKHASINDRISQQRKALWAVEGQIQVLEEAQSTRKLTNAEQALLLEQKQVLARAQQKAELGDQIAKQERLNQLNQDSVKFVLQMDQATKTLNDTRRMGALAAQREAERQKMQADWLAKGGSLEDDTFKRMQEAQEKYYAAEDEKRGDWLAGAQSAFATYGEEATNMYDNVGNIASNALSGMSDMMAEFLMTGEANFADFAKSIISQIIQMITKMVIFNSISGMMGGSTWSFAGGFANGGYTGNGGKYEPKGVVHGGEFVFTKEATSRIGVGNLNRLMRGYANGGSVGNASRGTGLTLSSGGAGAGNYIDVSGMKVDVNNGNDPKGLEQGIRMICNEMINESFSQGGKAYTYIMEKTGG